MRTVYSGYVLVNGYGKIVLINTIIIRIFYIIATFFQLNLYCTFTLNVFTTNLIMNRLLLDK